MPQRRHLLLILPIAADGADGADLAGMGAVRRHCLCRLTPDVLLNVGAVEPLTAIAGQQTVAAAGGTVSADVLAVGQREAQIQGIAVGEVIAGQTLTGIGIAAHRVHPAGALSIVELAQTVVIRLARQGQAVLQDLAPQVLRDGGIVHHAAPADAPQIEAHVHGAGVFVLVAPLLQRLDNGIGGRGILADFVGIRLLHHIQSHGGGVDDDIGRADDVAGIHEAVENAIGHEGGVALPVPGPDGNGVLHRIAHDGIREVELILVHRAAGGACDALSVHLHLDLAGVEGRACVGRGLHRQGEVAVAGLRHAVQIGDDGGGMLTDGGMILIGLLCDIPDGEANLLHRSVPLLAVEGNVVGLIAHHPSGVVLAVGAGEIPAVHGGIAVLQLHLQRLAVGVDEIGVKGQRVICQLVIGDLTVAEVRDDAGAGIVGGTGLRVHRAGAVVIALAGIIAGLRIIAGLLRLLRIVCGILRLLRGIGFLLGRLLVRLLRSLRFLRRVLVLRILRLLRGIGLLLLGGASLSLGADSLGRGLGQRLRLLRGKAHPGQHQQHHQGRRQHQRSAPP